jgi:hypothetical protein
MPDEFKHFFVASDLYEVGRNEFNEIITGEGFYVLGESDDGARIRHQNVFRNLLRSRSDDPDSELEFVLVPVFDAHDKAREFCGRITRHVAAGGQLNLLHWRHADPAYGSAAYVAEDTETERWFLERCEC